MGVDALTCEYHPRWQDHEFFNRECTCRAKYDDTKLHSETCGITPIYASLVPPEFNMLIGSFHAANAMMTQHTIKCADCGRERLGKDMLVIYQAPLVQAPPYNTSTYKYPHNIVKAVCPEHNRAGQVGYQRMGSAGYGNS